MPIYEYKCNDCHRTLEKRQKFSDPALIVCPFCEGHLEKMISAPAVQFKGGGWYADGYGNKSTAKSGGSSEGGSTTSSTSDSSSTKSSDTSSTTTASAPSAPASTPAASTPSSSSTTK